MEQVWYASYGSNMMLERFRYYLHGGRPVDATRDYPGARDRSEPAGAEPVELAGSVYFAWESPTWGGGIAFYDPDAGGTSFGRAYLVTTSQFADVAAQEMHRAPGHDLDLTDLLAHGRAVLGPGRYESLHVVGEIAGVPIVTFTASWVDTEIPLNAPVAAYLRMMARGLAETHGWETAAIVDYLLDRPGCRPTWTRDTLTAALDTAD